MAAIGTATTAMATITPSVIQNLSTGTSLSSPDLLADSGADGCLPVTLGLPFDPMFLLI
jgi:hypothetical protein